MKPILLRSRKIILSLVLLFFLTTSLSIIVRKSALIGELFQRVTLVEGLAGQPHLINPLYADLNPTDQLLTSLVYRGLVKFNQAGLPEGDLAENWEISEDGKVYTVTLKDSLYFHNRQKITAEDVVFTYQLTKLPEYQGPKKISLEAIEVESVGEQTIKFILKDPFAPFLETLTLGILPKLVWQGKSISEILKSEENLLPVGSGPLKVKKETLKFKDPQTIQSLSFEVLGSQLKEIRFRFYANEEDLVLAYKSGEIDSLTLTNPKLAQDLIGWPHLEVAQNILSSTQILLLFNHRQSEEQVLANEILGNLDFRKSLQQLVPGKIAQYSSFGPIPKALWAYKTDLVKFEYNPNQAQDTLTGLSAPQLTLSVLKKPYFTDLAKALKEEFEKVGLKIDLEILENNQFEEEVIKNKNFELVLLGQKLGFDPDQYSFWHSSQKHLPGLNISSFNNRRVDKALEEGRKTNNLEERKGYYESFQETMIQELPAIFLTHPQIFYFYPKKLKAEFPGVWWQAEDRFEKLRKWSLE